ncbi:DoxX family protein [Mucilaginibacter antarcticus]|uniref:DoxX family protein n=1 Tax=Mucilaginibacter antarcticus TaxID=1855725 RepID=A0ABW5XPA8_9SPHI
MKVTKVICWVVTLLFAGFMIFSSISNVTMAKEAVAFMKQLGYPAYFIPFIGVAKILGCIAILVPGYYRIKEWAYAGLFFDLIGATYSLICVFGVNSALLFMLLAIGLGAASYMLYHKVYGQPVKTL